MTDVLKLAGNLCNYVAQPSADADIAAHEGEGPFIAGDASAVAAWSGLNRGERWKVRVLGPIADMPMLWNHVRSFNYHATRESAVAHYLAMKDTLQHAVEGLRFEPHPSMPTGSAPGGLVEVAVNSGGGQSAVVMLDREHDYDYAMAMTPGMGALTAGNSDGPRVISWRPPPNAATVALGQGSGGRLDHVVLAFTPGTSDKRALIAAGLPGAGPDGQTRPTTFDVPSGVLVAQWARVSGASTLGPFGGNPGATLDAQLGQTPASTLQVADADLATRLAGPVAWAFRVTPGKWRAQLLYTDTDDGAGLSALVLSRDGAGSFQLMQSGGAGGKLVAGLTLERYAQLAAERDAISLASTQGVGGAVGAALMGVAGGGAVPELTQLAQRYGLPTDVSPGMLCRVTEWDDIIKGDAALSAEYAAFYGVAQAKASGVDVDIEAVRQQAMANQSFVAAAGKAHDTATAKTREGHFLLFEAARTMTAEALLDYARREAYAHLQPDELGWAFERALHELCLHADDPIRVQAPRQVCASFLAACWTATPADEREGSLAAFITAETRNVEEAYGINAPSLTDRL